MKRTFRKIIVGVVALLLMSSTMASADVVLHWNAIMLNTIGAENPFAQVRFAAITHTAVFEAVNSITGDYEPYLSTINAPPRASAKAAAVAAAHIVLKNYFPSSAVNLDLARATSLAAIPDGQAKDDGIAVGEAAAAAMIANRASDGSAVPEFYMPPSANPGEWQPTPPLCPSAGGIFLHWRNLTPFAIRKADQFRSSPPPPLTSNKYSKAYNEVKVVGELNSTARPQDRTDVARFATAGATRIWNQAVSQTSAAQGKSLSENARAFALLNMAINDGLISAMDTKYHYVFWRPYTAIRAGDTDGNRKTDPDVAWMTFIDTPCFPSYPSAHASASYAARTIAEKIFGSKGHDITLAHPNFPDVILHYGKFSQMTDDIDDARVYGGIHFRFDQEAGARQGRQVGSFVYKNTLRRCDNHDKDCGDDY